jgi:hypothetical protein
MPLLQSTFNVQAWPVPHLSQGEDPPQSNPLSPWLDTLSVQVGIAQRKTPVSSATQRLLKQSKATLHSFEFSHGLQVPPQSVSVSLGPLALSLHEGTAQVPLMQSMLATVGSQSAATLQADP